MPWGPKISCTKTQTLPNLRLPISSGNKAVKHNIELNPSNLNCFRSVDNSVVEPARVVESAPVRQGLQRGRVVDEDDDNENAVMTVRSSRGSEWGVEVAINFRFNFSASRILSLKFCPKKIGLCVTAVMMREVLSYVSLQSFRFWIRVLTPAWKSSVASMRRCTRRHPISIDSRESPLRPSPWTWRRTPQGGSQYQWEVRSPFEGQDGEGGRRATCQSHRSAFLQIEGWEAKRQSWGEVTFEL